MPGVTEIIRIGDALIGFAMRGIAANEDAPVIDFAHAVKRSEWQHRRGRPRYTAVVGAAPRARTTDGDHALIGETTPGMVGNLCYLLPDFEDVTLVSRENKRQETSFVGRVLDLMAENRARAVNERAVLRDDEVSDRACASEISLQIVGAPEGRRQFTGTER